MRVIGDFLGVAIGTPPRGIKRATHLVIEARLLAILKDLEAAFPRFLSRRHFSFHTFEVGCCVQNTRVNEFGDDMIGSRFF